MLRAVRVLVSDPRGSGRIFRLCRSTLGHGRQPALFGPTRGGDAAFQRWWGKCERLGASPSAAKALMRMNSQIDVGDILSAIRVPTLVVHRTDDVTINIEGGRYLAQNIPGARLVELPGTDHLPFIGDNAAEIVDAIEEFLMAQRRPSFPIECLRRCCLQTSSVRQKSSELGDRRWRDLLDRHNAIIRHKVSRFRGREINKTGDGFLITFDGPARAVRCACAIADEVRSIGVEIRAGLHTGECERSMIISEVSQSTSALAWRRLPHQAKSSYQAR